MNVSAFHASLAESTDVTVLKCTGLTDVWMIVSAASFMVSHASITASDFLSLDPEAGRSVTMAIHSFSLLKLRTLICRPHLIIVVQLREPRAAKAAVVRHVDGCGATKRLTDDVDGGIPPREAGTHRDPSNVV